MNKTIALLVLAGFTSLLFVGCCSEAPAYVPAPYHHDK